MGYTQTDLLVASRSLFAMLFGMAVLDEWLFPVGKHPGHERITRELFAFILHGAAGPRPEALSPAGESPEQ